MKKYFKISLAIFALLFLVLSCDSEPEHFTVSFDSDGGSKVESIVVESGKTITQPDNPTKTGFDFICWELDGKVFDFSTPITSDITLTAKWEKQDPITPPTPETKTAIVSNIVVLYENNIPNTISVDAVFEDGAIETIEIPTSEITINTPGTLKELTINHDNINLTLTVYITIGEDDPVIIDSADKLNTITSKDTDQNLGIITKSIETSAFYINNNDLHLYSTSQDNVISISKNTSNKEKIGLNSKNTVLKGFTIKTADNIFGTYMIKVRGNNNTLENLIFDLNNQSSIKSVNFIKSEDCKMLDCTIKNVSTRTNSFYGSLQIRESKNLLIDGLTINPEDAQVKVETEKVDTIVSSVTFNNLFGIKTVQISNYNSDIPAVITMLDTKFEKVGNNYNLKTE